MANRFLSNIRINDAYTFPASVGTTGQFLKITDAATGATNWADLTATTEVSTISYEVRNETGSSIPIGSVVYVNGGSGSSDHVTIALSSASSESTSSKTFGITSETIPNNSTGNVVLEGLVEGLDTSGFSPGQTLWLSTTAGQFQSTVPTTPDHAVFVGYAVRCQQNNGSIFVKIQNGYELGEIHDVKITSVADNNILAYNSTLGYWENTTETDPLFTASPAGSITSTDVSNWNEVYNEYAGLPEILIYRDNFTGNSSTVNFTMAQNADDEVTVQVYFDGIYQSKDNYSVVDDVITFSTAPPSGVSIEVITLTKFSASAGYITSETDPVFTASAAGSITGTQVTNWDTAYGWGDHASAGYAEDYTTSYISVDTTATAGNLYVFTATLTLTLPASPTAGDKVAISNMSGATTPVIARNGNLIAGLAEDLTVDVDNIGLQFIYSGATKGWILI